MGAGLLAGLAALAGPMLARVLLALGFSVVTLGGVLAAVDAAKSQLMSYIGAAPMAGIQVAGLMGAWEGLGMIFGAISFTLALWGLTKAVRIVKG